MNLTLIDPFHQYNKDDAYWSKQFEERSLRIYPKYSEIYRTYDDLNQDASELLWIIHHSITPSFSGISFGGDRCVSYLKIFHDAYMGAYGQQCQQIAHDMIEQINDLGFYDHTSIDFYMHPHYGIDEETTLNKTSITYAFYDIFHDFFTHTKPLPYEGWVRENTYLKVLKYRKWSDASWVNHWTADVGFIIGGLVLALFGYLNIDVNDSVAYIMMLVCMVFGLIVSIGFSLWWYVPIEKSIQDSLKKRGGYNHITEPFTNRIMDCEVMEDGSMKPVDPYFVSPKGWRK
jgi:hypothetical protein